MALIIEIGAAPCNEDCAQLGRTENFETLNRLEITLYRAAIIAAYGVPPEGVTLGSKSNHHDFGTYRELVARVATDKADEPEVCAYIERIEEGLSSWISAGFPPPVQYDRDGTATTHVRDADESIRSAMMVTRPNAHGAFFPADNEHLHRNLLAAFPDLVPDALDSLSAGDASSAQVL